MKSIDRTNKFKWETCSRCGIPDFMALSMIKIKDRLVCDTCVTLKEEKEILRRRYKLLGLDDSELDEKGIKL